MTTPANLARIDQLRAETTAQFNLANELLNEFLADPEERPAQLSEVEDWALLTTETLRMINQLGAEGDNKLLFAKMFAAAVIRLSAQREPERGASRG